MDRKILTEKKGTEKGAEETEKEGVPKGTVKRDRKKKKENGKHDAQWDGEALSRENRKYTETARKSAGRDVQNTTHRLRATSKNTKAEKLNGTHLAVLPRLALSSTPRLPRW